MGKVVISVFLVLLGLAAYFAFFGAGSEDDVSVSREERKETSRTPGLNPLSRTGQTPSKVDAGYRNPFSFGKELAKQRRALELARSSHGKEKKRSENFDREVDDIIRLIDSGRYEEVEARLKELIRKNPGDTEVLGILGDWYYENGRWKDGEEVYRSVVKLDPNDIQARNSLAKLLSFQGRHDDAISEYKESVMRDKKNGEALEGLASLYAVSGKVQEGQNYFNSFIEQNPANPTGYQVAASFYHENGNEDKAIEILQKGLSVASPADPKINSLLGMIYAQRGNYHEALKYYTGSVETCKEPGGLSREQRELCKESYGMLSELSARTGDRKKSRYYMEQVIAVDPMSDDAKYLKDEMEEQAE